MLNRLLVAAVLIISTCGAAEPTPQAPDSATQGGGSIAFDVKWRVSSKGYDGYMNLSLHAQYRARRLPEPTDCDPFWKNDGFRHGPIEACYALSYVTGSLLQGSAAFGGEKGTISPAPNCIGSGLVAYNALKAACDAETTGPLADAAGFNAGLVFISKDHKGEIVFRKSPAFYTNGPGEDAAGCIFPERYHFTFTGVSPEDLSSFQNNWNINLPTQPEGPGCQSNITLNLVASCAGIDALQMFQRLMPVFNHPRCFNCHGGTNPITGANHGGGPIDVGPQTPGNTIRVLGHNTECLTCHDAEVTKDASGQEKGPWRLPPEPMEFVGKDTKAICEQISNFQFGGSPSDLPTHFGKDDLIGLGFAGLAGGAASTANPPPMSRAQFVQLGEKWATEGRHECTCVAPEGDP